MLQTTPCQNQCALSQMIKTSEGNFCMSCGKLATSSSKNKNVDQKTKPQFGVLAKDMDIKPASTPQPAAIIKSKVSRSVKIGVAGITGHKSRARLAS